MSHAILDSDEPIRAMIVVAGNPLLSIAGQERLRKAFEQLDLLVVIDIYPSATAELAHVVLPSTDMYERDDLNIVNIGTSAQPFAQYTPAVVAPHADRMPEWWIAHRLLQELGLPSILDDDTPDPWAKWRHMLSRGSGVDLADLQGGKFIGFDQDIPTRKALDQFFREQRIELEPSMEFDNIETLKRAVEVDAGVALVHAMEYPVGGAVHVEVVEHAFEVGQLAIVAFLIHQLATALPELRRIDAEVREERLVLHVRRAQRLVVIVDDQSSFHDLGPAIEDPFELLSRG
jgi:hypothetical protein